MSKKKTIYLEHKKNKVVFEVYEDFNYNKEKFNVVKSIPNKSNTEPETETIELETKK